MNPLPAGLRTLLLLRAKGRVRRIGRDLKSVKGFILFAVGVSMFALWMLPVLIGNFQRGTAIDPETFRMIFPFVLLGFTLLGLFTSSGERAIYFSPSEISFLFSGPFTRRQLLVYRLVSTQGGMLFTAFIFSIILNRFSTSWLATFAGAYLAFQFVYLFGLVFTMTGEIVAERAYTRARRLVAGLVVLVVLAGAWRLFSAADAEDALGFAVQARSHPAVQSLLLPLEPYGQLITAARFIPDAIPWIAAAAAVNGVLAGIVMALDANYVETAMAVSQKHYTRMQRWRQGGMMTTSAKAARRRLPMLPRLGGAGVLCWRQMTAVLRSGRMFIFLLIPFAVFSIFMIATREQDADLQATWLIAGSVLAWITIMFAGALRFDFRSDLDQIEYLKTLPLHSMAIAAGQMSVPVLLMLGFQAVIAGVATWYAGPLWAFPVVLLIAFPINIFILAIENLVFLVMPTRVMGRGPGDFQFMGRQMLLMLVKLAVIGAAFAAAAAVGGLIYLIAGPMWIAIGVAAWSLFLMEAAALLPLVGWAYARFDPSRDMPV